jgi:hypothetical protein
MGYGLAQRTEPGHRAMARVATVASAAGLVAGVHAGDGKIGNAMAARGAG